MLGITVRTGLPRARREPALFFASPAEAGAHGSMGPGFRPGRRRTERAATRREPSRKRTTSRAISLVEQAARSGRLAGIAPAAVVAADRLADFAARRDRADTRPARIRAAAKGYASGSGTAAQTHSAATARPHRIGGSRRTRSQRGRQAEGRPAGGRETSQGRNSTRRDEAAREAATDGGVSAAAAPAGETRCAEARPHSQTRAKADAGGSSGAAPGRRAGEFGAPPREGSPAPRQPATSTSPICIR